MRKNIIIYGLISGLLVSIFMLVSMNYFSHCEGKVDYGTSMLIGYASMLIAFSLVYVGVRNYRDKYNNGFISFGKAFQIGFFIVLIASTMYVIAWMIDFFFFMPDFMDKYSAQMLADLKATGKSAAEIEMKTKEMADMAVMYKKPYFTALFTYIEILPVGLIVSLISGLLLKKKSVDTDIQNKWFGDNA
jgi:hypothetical protein